jgi:hypothetical protein
MTDERLREELRGWAKRLRVIADSLSGIADGMDTLTVEEINLVGEKPEEGDAKAPEGTANLVMAEADTSLEEAVKKAAQERKEGKVVLEVHEVLEQTAKTIFGEAAKDPNRRYWVLYHLDKTGKSRRIGQIPIPTDPSKISPNSLAAAYVAKYGHLPRAGDMVELKRGEKGFLELVL